MVCCIVSIRKDDLMKITHRSRLIPVKPFLAVWPHQSAPCPRFEDHFQTIPMYMCHGEFAFAIIDMCQLSTMPYFNLLIMRSAYPSLSLQTNHTEMCWLGFWCQYFVTKAHGTRSGAGGFVPRPEANAATMELNGSQRMPLDALRTAFSVYIALGLKYRYLSSWTSGEATSGYGASAKKVSSAPL